MLFLLTWFMPLCFALLVYLDVADGPRDAQHQAGEDPPARRTPAFAGRTWPASRRRATSSRRSSSSCTNPKRFQQLGAQVPKGVLLYGPPGTGKTLLAKAVAHESGANFFCQSARRRSSRCTSASARPASGGCSTRRARTQPAIVFIDELDAVGTARGGARQPRARPDAEPAAGRAGRVRRAPAADRDGASNRLEDLDPALLRPGRFDRQILVSPPDVAGREEICGVHTRDKPLADDVDLTRSPAQTPA